jgi:sugar O-acyltransferase (sialic acid O-acetyltransferase NeuD family)
MNEIILIGGGGHCRSCIDVIETANTFRIAGIVDFKENAGSSILGYKIIASDEDLPSLAKAYNYFLITIGQIKSAAKRKSLLSKLKRLKLNIPVIVSPYAHVSRFATISEGSIVMHHCVINSGARIGDNCIINTHAIVEHDCTIGNNCHISTGAICNGEVTIEDECFIGSGSIIKETISIKKGTIIAAGSVVIKNCETVGVFAGNPARKVK